MTGNYMPSGPDREVDDSMFTYGPKQSKTSESDTQTSNCDSCESNSSTETLESMPELVVVEPKVISQPKVWPDAPIIEEYESDSDDEYVIQPSKEQERPSFAFVKHVKTPRETVKEQNTYSPSPKANKRDWNGLMSKRLGLGYGFTKKTCFVCGSFSHLIRDCDFQEKRMAKQVELNKKKVVLTRTGRIPVNSARQNLSSQVATTSTARKVNTARSIVNEIRPRNNFYKSHSPIRRPFNRTTTPRTNFLNHKVNTAGVKAVSAVGEKGKLLLSPQQVVIGDPKDITGTNSPNTMVDQILENDNPQRALKNKWIVDSGCSMHITENKAYLAEYQDYNGALLLLEQFNLFSVSQMCDKKNKVLFTDTECLMLSSDFKLLDENQVLLRIPKQNNMYSFNIENIVPSGGLACLIAKDIIDESNKWHRRFGHVNLKNLKTCEEGKPCKEVYFKEFSNDHTCVACHKESNTRPPVRPNQWSSISQSLKLIQMDLLLGPTSRFNTKDAGDAPNKHPNLKIMEATEALPGREFAQQTKDFASTTGQLNPRQYALMGKRQLKQNGFIEIRRKVGRSCGRNKKQELIYRQMQKASPLADFYYRNRIVAADRIAVGQNPVYHSKTKHIAIRHHFIRDAYEKKLIQVLKIHTDDNVADLLTKAFDVY
ncbi:ribonuclease H-like domain-containing protein [Tanacetum coccineum]|uniref:Ribonuclease H-like domain-containing protein n=1 Tax=Tanacetum coccineum TaxID=301880 RepID=A0ABQ5ETA9_9ASTR